MIRERDILLETINNGNLVGTDPKQMLPIYGASKKYLDIYHWHSPFEGVVASYAPTKTDVEDHFGIFRGVDQVEAFAQASIVSCATFLECRKQNCTPHELMERFIPAFISIGQVQFHNYLEFGDSFISIGHIKFYKWRQMVCDGRMYKVPKYIDLDEYFRDFNRERLLKYDISKDFILVAELFDITGRAIKIELLNNINKNGETANT